MQLEDKGQSHEKIGRWVGLAGQRWRVWRAEGVAGRTPESGTNRGPENRIAERAWSLAQVGRGASGKTE